MTLRAHRRPLGALLALASLLLCAAPLATAQDMSRSVVTRALAVARGANDAKATGRAAYGTSHVYTLDARAGQRLVATLRSPADAVTFSAIAPRAGTLDGAFGVTRWSGVLPESGRYRLVLVMNTPGLAPVRFRLTASVR